MKKIRVNARIKKPQNPCGEIGHWVTDVTDPAFGHCSVCGEMVDDIGVIHFDYCPYCGARMMEEEMGI